MAIRVTHAVVATGTNDGSKQVSKNAWNDDHVIEGGIQPATVTLSSADILDLHNTPITLVAAPGAGKWLDLHRYEVYYAYGTADYTTNDSGPVIYVGDAAAA